MTRLESNRKLGDLNRTHGMTKHPCFRMWVAMRMRCQRKKDPRWKDYGGRGIKVCDRWRHSFAAFIQDMGPRPSPNHSIDRYPNNDGNYEPGNCRWATRHEQQQHTRRTRTITFEGVSYSIAEWTRRCGLGRGMIAKRLRNGWSIEEALFTSKLESLRT